MRRPKWTSQLLIEHFDFTTVFVQTFIIELHLFIYWSCCRCSHYCGYCWCFTVIWPLVAIRRHSSIYDTRIIHRAFLKIHRNMYNSDSKTVVCNDILSALTTESGLTRWQPRCPANGPSRWCFWQRFRARRSSLWSTHPGLSPGQSHTPPSQTPSPLSRGLRT